MHLRTSSSLFVATFLTTLGFASCATHDEDRAAVDGGAGGRNGSGRHPCIDPTPVSDVPGLVSCEGGWLHRTEAITCPTPTRSDAGGLGCWNESECFRDTECAGPYAYCDFTGAAGASCGCHSGCRVDADCGDDRICLCGETHNRCVPASCKTDADCPEGLLCRYDPSLCAGSLRCQTPADECASDADCAEADAGGECRIQDGRHQCVPECVIGRPFIVADGQRVAPLEPGADWLVPTDVQAETLDAEIRSTLAEAWAEIGLLEHASVAAFARFAMDLASLGAPPTLMQAAASAMSDEIQHAQAAFALSSAYAGKARGPGALDIHGAVEDRSPLVIIQTALIEGCIGETVAAFEAAEASAHAEDPALRRVLARIAEDETAHAALAWRFVRWSLSHPGLEKVTREALAALDTSTQSDPAAPSEADRARLRHGIVTRAVRDCLRRTVMEEVVGPCFADLLGQGASPRRSREPLPRPTPAV